MRLWHSFVFKFLLLFVALLLLVVSASGWYFLNRQDLAAFERATLANESAVKVVEGMVQGSLTGFGQNLTLLATVPDLVSDDPMVCGRFLKSYNVSNLLIPGERLALYGANGRLVADNTMFGETLSDSAFTGRVQPLRPTVSPTRWLGNLPVKTFAVTVQDRAKADRALVADYSFKRLWAQLLEFHVGESGYVVVVDSAGFVLFHPDVKNWLATPTSIEKMGISGFDPKTYRSPAFGYEKFADGSEYLVSYHYSAVSGLGILAVQPRQQIDSASDPLRDGLLILLALVITAIVVASAWLHWTIGRPLNHLIARMKRVHDGDLEAESGIVRSDEIGLFASEFDLMRQSLRNSIRELAHHKDILEDTVKARTAALQKANRALKLMSHTDHLTGIPNRRDIMEKVHYEMFRSERTHKPFSFLFADIDKFKNFNDTYGHECGDVVLKTVAQVVRGMLRKPDYIARWGGEEFLVVLPETSLENATLVADRVRTAVAGTEFAYGGHIFKVTITIGVSLFDNRLGIEHSINLADRALYKGKEAGRNRVEVFDPNDITEDELLAASRMREERGGHEFPIPEVFELDDHYDDTEHNKSETD